jgi:drug/metabolite transporter (DMT)-like permease
LYGSYLILAKPLIEKYQQSYLFALLFSLGLVFSLPFGYQDTAAIPWGELPYGAYWGLLYIGVAVTYGTFVLIAYALKNASPSLVGLYMYLQPVLAWGFSLLLGTEDFMWSKLGIGLLIMAGVYLVTFQRKSNARI